MLRGSIADMNPDEALEAVRHTIVSSYLVKGGDYEKADIVGSAEVEGWGGRVEIIPLLEGRSTSNLIQKILG